MEAVKDRSEELKKIEACMKKLVSAELYATLEEFRIKDKKSIEIDSRVGNKSVNTIRFSGNYAMLDMKYDVYDKNEMLSLRALFGSFMQRQTDAVLAGGEKLYKLTFDFISTDKETETAYRTVCSMPLMCVMEEFNSEFILHCLFEMDSVSFLVEGYDNYELEQDMQYLMAQRDEALIKGNSSSSELDGDDPEDDPYYVDNM